MGARRRTIPAPVLARRSASGYDGAPRCAHRPCRRGLCGRRTGACRLPGGRLRRRPRGCLERRRPAVRGPRRGRRRHSPVLRGRRQPIAPTAYIQPFRQGAGGVCITPGWLHFDIVFHALSCVDPKAVQGMVPLVDKARLLPERAVPPPSVVRRLSSPWQWWSTSCTCSATWSRSSGGTSSYRPPMVWSSCAYRPRRAAAGRARVGDHSGAQFRQPFPLHQTLAHLPHRRTEQPLAFLPPLAATIDSVIDGYLALARAFLPRARSLADKTANQWPAAYEAALVSYFERSLGVRCRSRYRRPFSDDSCALLANSINRTGNNAKARSLLTGVRAVPTGEAPDGPRRASALPQRQPIWTERIRISLCYLR